MNINSVPIAATFSKDSTFWGHNFPVQYLTEGSGARVRANDGKWYLDWVSGLGAILLGYSNVEFNAAVALQVQRGAGFSLPSHIEYEAAEKLTTLFQKQLAHWHTVPLQVRWVKTGSDACIAALRLARAVTGKKVVLSYGYHGWHADFISMTPPAHGIIPEVSGYMQSIQWNDFDSLMQYDDRDDIAAVIIEQPLEEPGRDWYTALRRFCDEHQALLIMDEVVTGFRYALGGATEKYDVEPDLICLGKSLGNGYPIAALVGPREYMSWFSRNDPVFVSSTNAGDAVSLMAANKFLEIWPEAGNLRHIWKIGEKLLTGLREVGWKVPGNPPRSVIIFDDDYEKAFFILEMVKRDILINRPNMPNLAHTKLNVIDTVTAARGIYTEMCEIGLSGVHERIGNKLPTVLFRNR